MLRDLSTLVLDVSTWVFVACFGCCVSFGWCLIGLVSCDLGLLGFCEFAFTPFV